jgi:ABC-type multidrug transport system ATPase subunit
MMPPFGFVEVEDLVVTGQQGFRLEVPRFAVDRPGVVALIGRNGSGKSSFLDTLLNLVEPERGRVALLGGQLHRLAADDPVRFSIGMQGGGMVWNYGIKVAEIMALHRAIYRRCDAGVLDRLGIAPLSPMLYRRLSTGQRRRADLAVALAHAPQLILLDEPTAGLDQGFQEGFRALVAERAAAGAAVLMASHDPDDLAMAARVVWFENGRIIGDGSPAELVSRHLGDHLCSVGVPAGAEGTPLREAIGAAVGPAATFWRSADGQLQFAGDGRMRQLFLDAVAAAAAPDYAVRRTTASDLVTLLTTVPMETRA